MDQALTTILTFYGGILAVGCMVCLIGVWLTDKHF